MDWNLEERENKAITQIFLNKCEVTWIKQLRCLKSVCIYTSYWRNCSCSQQEKGGRLVCRLRTTGLETNMRHYEQQKGSRMQKLEKVAKFIVGHLS